VCNQETRPRTNSNGNLVKWSKFESCHSKHVTCHQHSPYDIPDILIVLMDQLQQKRLHLLQNTLTMQSMHINDNQN
jgi:hypothetical protein